MSKHLLSRRQSSPNSSSVNLIKDKSKIFEFDQLLEAIQLSSGSQKDVAANSVKSRKNVSTDVKNDACIVNGSSTAFPLAQEGTSTSSTSTAITVDTIPNPNNYISSSASYQHKHGQKDVLGVTVQGSMNDIPNKAIDKSAEEAASSL